MFSANKAITILDLHQLLGKSYTESELIALLYAEAKRAKMENEAIKKVIIFWMAMFSDSSRNHPTNGANAICRHDAQCSPPRDFKGVFH